MFRQMRRANQQLDERECGEILSRATSGVLAVAGEDGYPYAVPLSFAFINGKLYFHCAQAGYKLDAINNCDKVSFCVIDQDNVIPEHFTTHYRSVIVFGRARILQNDDEIRSALSAIAMKYSPERKPDREIESNLQHVRVIELTPEQMTGKQARELCKEK